MSVMLCAKTATPRALPLQAHRKRGRDARAKPATLVAADAYSDEIRATSSPELGAGSAVNRCLHAKAEARAGYDRTQKRKALRAGLVPLRASWLRGHTDQAGT